jgi:hypothetical protein
MILEARLAGIHAEIRIVKTANTIATAIAKGDITNSRPVDVKVVKL